MLSATFPVPIQSIESAMESERISMRQIRNEIKNGFERNLLFVVSNSITFA